MGEHYLSVEGLGAAVTDTVLRLTLARPGQRNALDDVSMAALISNLETASTDEEVRAVLLCGDGEDFCSGFDIVGRNAQRDVRPRTGSIQRRSSRSPDFREGMKAFTERRPPEFTGQ